MAQLVILGLPPLLYTAPPPEEEYEPETELLLNEQLASVGLPVPLFLLLYTAPPPEL